jgi:hypothetical protein
LLQLPGCTWITAAAPVVGSFFCRRMNGEGRDGAGSRVCRARFAFPMVPLLVVGSRAEQPGHQDIRVSGYQGIRISGHQDITVSGYQGIRISGYQDIRASGYHGIRISGYQDIRVSGYQGITIPGHQGDRALSHHTICVFAVGFRGCTVPGLPSTQPPEPDTGQPCGRSSAPTAMLPMVSQHLVRSGAACCSSRSASSIAQRLSTPNWLHLFAGSEFSGKTRLPALRYPRCYLPTHVCHPRRGCWRP